MDADIVKDYLKRLDIKSGSTWSGVRKYLKKRFGQAAADKLCNMIDQRGRGDLQNNAFYSTKNEKKDVSVALSSLFEGNTLCVECEWIYEHRELFGETILDVGCENGILTCFLGVLFPASRITGVDKCENAIKVASELAAELGLTNVAFQTCDVIASGMKETFDTVFSSKVAGETFVNEEPLLTSGILGMGKKYKDLLQPYADAISKCLSPGGIFVSLERMSRTPALLGWLMALVESGIPVTPGTVISLESKEVGETAYMQSVIGSNELLFMDCICNVLRSDNKVKKSLPAQNKKIGYVMTDSGLPYKEYTPFCYAIPESETEEVMYYDWTKEMMLLKGDDGKLETFVKNHLMRTIPKGDALAYQAFCSSFAGHINHSAPMFFGFEALMIAQNSRESLVRGYHVYDPSEGRDLFMRMALWKSKGDETAVFIEDTKNTPPECTIANYDVDQSDALIASMEKAVREGINQGQRIVGLSYALGVLSEKKAVGSKSSKVVPFPAGKKKENEAFLTDSVAAIRKTGYESRYPFIEGKDRESDFKKYMLSYAIKYFLLMKNNYAAISRIYSAMDLYDNKRLLKTFHSEAKGTSVSVVVNSKGVNGEIESQRKQYGPKIDVKFSTVIYEDIIKLAVEEIVDRKNLNLYKFVVSLIRDAMTDLTEEDSPYQKYFQIFLSLMDDKEDTVETPFAKEVYRALFSDTVRDFTADAKVSLNMYYNFIPKDHYARMGRFLEKTADEFIAAAEKCLKEENRGNLFNALRMSHPLNVAKGEHSDFFSPLSTHFNDLLHERHYHFGIYKHTVPEWTDTYLRHKIELMLAYYFPAAMKQNSENDPNSLKRPPLSCYPPVESLLAELYNMLLADGLIAGLDELQVSYYQNFNFDKVEKLDTIRTMTGELHDAKATAQNYRNKYENLRKKYDALEAALKDKQKNIDAIVRQQLSETKSELNDLQQKLDAVQKKCDAQENYIRVMEEEPEVIEAEPVDLSVLMEYKFMFLGGRAEVIAELRKRFPTAVFCDNNTDTVNLETIDCLVMFINNMSHSLFYKFNDQAKRIGIKIVYCKVNNIDQIIQKIYNAVSVK